MPENMHYFVAEIAQQEITAVNIFQKRAEGIYDENLNAYVKLVLRRPFAKIIVCLCRCNSIVYFIDDCITRTILRQSTDF